MIFFLQCLISRQYVNITDIQLNVILFLLFLIKPVIYPKKIDFQDINHQIY